MCTLRLTDVKYIKISLNSPALQKLGQFLIDYASRQTSFELSTNPLKAKWVRSSQATGGANS